MLMTPRRPVFITPGNHPFEVMILLACVVAGGAMIVTGLRPPSLLRGLPEQVMTVWLALIAVGGIVSLLGAFWRHDVADGLLIEAAGLIAISAACTLYVIALFALNPIGNALASAGLLTGIAGGAWYRMAQCLLDRRRLLAAVQSISSELDPDLTVFVQPVPESEDDHPGDE